MACRSPSGHGSADVAADAKIGAVVGADGAVSNDGALGGAAGGIAVVGVAADLDVQKDLGVGDAALPDLELNKAGEGFSDVKGDMQEVEDTTEVNPVVQQEEDVKQEADHSADSKRTKDAPYNEVSSSDGSLEYDSTESTKTMDRRNVGSFTRKTLAQLWGGSLRYVKHGRYTCPWHGVKPRCGTLKNLAQHAKDLACSGKSERIRAQHAALAKVLVEVLAAVLQEEHAEA
ncbi:hypothetical protein ACQ4PT_061843 [Festuca glaucescens]